MFNLAYSHWPDVLQFWEQQ